MTHQAPYTTELTDFIAARLAEDQRYAQEAGRALAVVTALRAILDAHPLTDCVVGYGSGTEKFGCMVCHDWDGVTEGHGYCTTVRVIASIWDDHSDYRPEWSLTPHPHQEA